MATSGQYTFQQQKNEILQAALRMVKATVMNEPATAEDSANASDVLNRMLKFWMSMDIPIWKEDQVYLFLTQGQNTYTLGAGGDRCVQSYVNTTITSNLNIASVVIPVSDITGMSVNDNIGIQLNNGTLFWSTIASFAGNDVTINNPLTDGATNGAIVFAYTDIINFKIQKIKQVSRIEAAGTETPLNAPLPRERWVALTDKVGLGMPYYAYYQPLLTNGKVYLWRNPQNVNQVMSFSCVIPFQDMVGPNNDFDFPVEWEEPIVYNLAKRLLIFHPCDPQTAADIKEGADTSFEVVRGYDREEGSIWIAPDYNNGGESYSG